MQDNEPTFPVSRDLADRFCSWLVGLGGWAASSHVEPPVIHRLLRTANPDNRIGIPRMDLVVTAAEDGPKEVSIRREFHPLFLAFHAYDQCQYKGV